jgi:hypothetical protein
VRAKSGKKQEGRWDAHVNQTLMRRIKCNTSAMNLIRRSFFSMHAFFQAACLAVQIKEQEQAAYFVCRLETRQLMGIIIRMTPIPAKITTPNSRKRITIPTDQVRKSITKPLEHILAGAYP